MALLRSVFVTTLIFISFCLNAQVKFSAFADARQVIQGQYFTVTFSLENARGNNFQAPSFVNFDVASGPSTSTEMTFLNGQSKQKISYIYTLTAPKVGKFVIQPASIRVNKKVYKSEPITIEVLKGRESRSDPDAVVQSDFQVEAAVDFEEGYVGQQITLKYVLLSTKEVRSHSFKKLPTFDGFFAQEIHNSNSRTERVVKDGVQYFRRVLKVFALFPQQKGIFTLEPASLVAGISDGRRSNSFFFNTRLKQFRIESSSVDIKITGTPTDAPISFCGAIGDFYLGTAVDKKSVTMDDAVTLTLQIRGFGDGKFIEAPKQPYTSDFDIYDPNLLNEKNEVIGDKIQVTKTYEYLMIPKRTGLIKFNPELSYYDVDSARYITIYAQQYRVNVLEGSERELADLENTEFELPAPSPVKKLYDKDKYFAYSWGHIGTNGVILLSIFSLFIVRRVIDKRENMDPAIKRKMKAKKLAIEKLAIAREALDVGDFKTFYIQLRKGLQEYLSDKTNQETSQLSKVHIKTLLNENNLDAHSPMLLEIMQKGEQAIYASIAPGKETEDYEKSLQIIEEIEVALS